MKMKKVSKKANHTALVYRVYDYLKNCHNGEENKISKPELAKMFGIAERTLRRITMEINASEELDKIISVSDGCYVCKTREECMKAIYTTYATAITEFKKAKNMERKVGLNNQYKIRLGKYYKDMVETFTE